MARTSIYSDAPPYTPSNTAGILMSRYITVKRARNTQSIRDGIGLVRKRDAITEVEAYERPRTREIERIMGFQTGDADAPELHALPEATRQTVRQGVLRNGTDVRLLTRILYHSPKS